jgi:drug/metabolite transporter (DMT)-like permease
MEQMKSTEQQGETYIILGAILWSLFPVVTLLTYRSLGPLSSLAWTTLVSAIFFFCVSSLKKSWKSVFRKDILLPLALVTLLLSIIFYPLFFFGLQHTSAGNAAIVATLEILFTYLFFNVWKKEFFSLTHIVGALLIGLSGVIILSPQFETVRQGDLLILLAVMTAPFGNFYQKRLRETLPAEQILFYRTLIACPVLFLLAYWFEGSLHYPAPLGWLLILGSGICIFGLSKIFWIEGIFRISVTKAIALSSISPVLTLIFAFLILGDYPTLTQISAVIPAVMGVYFLTRPSQAYV